MMTNHSFLRGTSIPTCARDDHRHSPEGLGRVVSISHPLCSRCFGGSRLFVYVRVCICVSVCVHVCIKIMTVCAIECQVAALPNEGCLCIVCVYVCVRVCVCVRV